VRIRQDVNNAIGAFESWHSSAAGISEILFYVFIALAIASFLLGLMRCT
jgi:uncharacterized membrane protein YtjA (UPF0391 family)